MNSDHIDMDTSSNTPRSSPNSHHTPSPLNSSFETVSPLSKNSDEKKSTSPVSNGDLSMPDLERSASDLAAEEASATHSKVYAGGGVLFGWGCGMSNLLGTESEENQTLPTAIPYMANRKVRSVAAGTSHALAVVTDSLYSWGRNDEGECGTGDTNSLGRPSEITILQTKQIVGVAAGYAHSLALTSVGEVFSFGQGEMGQLGLTMKTRPKGTPPDLSRHVNPSLVRELSQITKVISIACGENHSLALSSAGRVYSVGEASRGALGLDITSKHNTASTPTNGYTDEVSGGVRVAVFTEITSLLPMSIMNIAAGSHHSLFVTCGGTVYSCGDSGKGRLGYSLANAAHAIQWTPKKISFGNSVDSHAYFIQASGGGQYSLFLTQCGDVYGCGDNRHGEMGVSSEILKAAEMPRIIPGLANILEISAGTTHALARDTWNRVWSFGSGSNGELGRSNEIIKQSTSVGPVQLPQVFPYQHVVSVTAGSNTSYCVIAETVLANKPGTPNKKMLVSPSESLVSPNSYQMFSTSSSFDFSSSLSSSSASSTPSPAAVPPFLVSPHPSSIPLTAFSYSHFLQLARKKDYVALTNYVAFIFSSALILNSSFLPSQSSGGGSYIDHNLLELVYAKILKISLVFPRIQTNLTIALQKTISSMVMLLKQNARQPPRDLAAYRCVFIAFQSPHLLQAGRTESQVLTDLSFILKRIPKEVTLDRIQGYLYQNIPYDLLQNRFIRILTKNIENRLAATLGGRQNARVAIIPEEVQDWVQILDGIHQAVAKKEDERKAMNFLSLTAGSSNSSSLITHNHGGLVAARRAETNDNLVPTIPDSAWHINLMPYIDLQTDLMSYTEFAPTAAQLPKFSFMRYSYLLAPAIKVNYLKLEFQMQLQHQFIGAAISNINPYLQLKIRRSNIVEDTVNALNKHSIWELRRPLKVSFVDEVGEDQGGLSAEFFELAFRELFLPQYQLFEVRREWKTFWFSSLPCDPSKQALMQCFGMLLGICVYNGASVHLNLPIWLYAQLLGMKPTLEMLKMFDPQLASSFEELLRFQGDVENTFCLTFEVSVTERSEAEINKELLSVLKAETAASAPALPAGENEDDTCAIAPLPSSSSSSAMIVDDEAGSTTSSQPSSGSNSPTGSSGTAMIPSKPRRIKNIPLLPGGDSIPVTQTNKYEYVQLYIDWLLTKSVSESLGPLIEGFQSIVGRVKGKNSETASMGMFTPADLELLVVGEKNVDYNDLKKGTRYEGGYHPQHPTIVDFWSIVLNELSPVEQRQLLIFCTGSSRVPVGGLSQVRLLIQRAGPDSENLPTSSTCFHALLLPEYASSSSFFGAPAVTAKQKLKEKLKLALANAVGFGLR